MEASLVMVFGDAPKHAKPLADEAMAVLAGIGVGITDHHLFRVLDRQVGVNPIPFLGSLVNLVVISTQNNASIAVLGNVGFDILEVFSDLKPHSSVAATDECHDWWFVRFEVSAPLFLSPRSRGLSSSSSIPFSPAVT